MGVVHQGETEGCGTGVYESNIIYIISTSKENILQAKIVDIVLHMYMFVVSDFFFVCEQICIAGRNKHFCCDQVES